MIAYTRPGLGVSAAVHALLHRRKLARSTLDRWSGNAGTRSMIVRARARDVLAALFLELRWTGRRVALPCYTCPSLAAAIAQTGNIPVFYKLGSDFQIDGQSFAAQMALGVDAVILSDVYGIQVELPRDLGGMTVNRPLLIGDFAHHFDVSGPDRRDFDFILYSGAFYKPSAVAGFGLGIVCSERVSVSTSVRVEYGLWPALLETLRGLVYRAILSPAAPRWVASHLSRRLLRPQTTEWLPDTTSKATAVGLAQTSLREKVDPIRLGATLAQYRTAILPSDPFRLLNPEVTTRGASFSFIVVQLDPSLDRESVYCEMADAGYLLGRVFWQPAGTVNNGCDDVSMTHVLNLPICPTLAPAQIVEQLRGVCRKLMP